MAALQLHTSKNLDIYSAQTDTELQLPLMEGVRAGFPSPATDFIDLNIDLNRHLIKHPSATYYAKVKGESMKDAGISDGDLLIIDKSIDPIDGKIAICYLDGEFMLKRIKIRPDGVWLMPANSEFSPVKVQENNNLIIWGIVTYVIKTV
jgi:DNA polymerase V